MLFKWRHVMPQHNTNEFGKKDLMRSKIISLEESNNLIARLYSQRLYYTIFVVWKTFLEFVLVIAFSEGNSEGLVDFANEFLSWVYKHSNKWLQELLQWETRILDSVLPMQFTLQLQSNFRYYVWQCVEIACVCF